METTGSDGKPVRQWGSSLRFIGGLQPSSNPLDVEGGDPPEEDGYYSDFRWLALERIRRLREEREERIARELRERLERLKHLERVDREDAQAARDTDRARAAREGASNNGPSGGRSEGVLPILDVFLYSAALMCATMFAPAWLALAMVAIAVFSPSPRDEDAGPNLLHALEGGGRGKANPLGASAHQRRAMYGHGHDPNTNAHYGQVGLRNAPISAIANQKRGRGQKPMIMRRRRTATAGRNAPQKKVPRQRSGNVPQAVRERLTRQAIQYQYAVLLGAPPPNKWNGARGTIATIRRRLSRNPSGDGAIRRTLRRWDMWVEVCWGSPPPNSRHMST